VFFIFLKFGIIFHAYTWRGERFTPVGKKSARMHGKLE